ncbi:hypothetical protein [Burkholderia ubonensis]|uniref:hypothetical protein n=1 Tax=Burkholderia ubonensis TaxID=101571 RepID=UPI00076D2C54|nr:hypothetical protein [Burkholderia ubonensis]KVP75283.1 hypothetical protein WJ93_07665 [Burkholderia ubonensis]
MRTVEHIVSCHQAAAELRKQNKPIWPYKANIQQVLDTLKVDPTVDQLVDGCKKMAAILRAALPATWLDIHHADYDPTFEDIIERMEEFSADDFNDPHYEGPGDAVDCMILTELYDWADTRRIWLRA